MSNRHPSAVSGSSNALRMPEPLSLFEKPFIGFRVEVNDPSNWWNYNANELRSRDPDAPATAERMRAHLLWDRSQSSPFVSFFTNWSDALRRREFFLKRGERNISIHVVWLREMHVIYSAIDAAAGLGLEAKPYLINEVLVLDQCHVSREVEKNRLCTFNGGRALEVVVFQFKALRFEAEIPVGHISQQDFLAAIISNPRTRHSTSSPGRHLESKDQRNAELLRDLRLEELDLIDGHWNTGAYPPAMKRNILVMSLGMRAYTVTIDRRSPHRRCMPCETKYLATLTDVYLDWTEEFEIDASFTRDSTTSTHWQTLEEEALSISECGSEPESEPESESESECGSDPEFAFESEIEC